MTQEGRTMQFRVPNGQCHPGDSSVPLVQLQVTKSRCSSFGLFGNRGVRDIESRSFTPSHSTNESTLSDLHYKELPFSVREILV